MAVFPFNRKDHALKCVLDSHFGGRVFEATILDEGLPGNPDVEYVNGNSSLIEFEQEEKLRHLQEMIVGLMVGLGIEGKVRKKDGYFKVHYAKDEIDERVTGHIIHPPTPERCGTQYYPHLMPNDRTPCRVCFASEELVLSDGENHLLEGNGFGAEAIRRINEAKSSRMRERMRRGVEKP